MDSQLSYAHRLAWGTDAGFYRLIPQEVLHPATEADVQQIMQRAHREGRHITFRAAGTSLSGQAISDSLLVVCGKKWEQSEVLDDGMRIRLQPGIIGQRVNDILRPYGRRFTPDPASIKSAMVGGIVNNNASGMCCGTHANSYRMLQSVRIILPDGTILDTGDETSREAFRRTHSDFIRRIEQLRDRVQQDEELKSLILKKYSIKNVTGLTILPFAEYTDPFDIIARLIPGSEGTLAFLSEITMLTGEDYQHSASALLLFPTTDSACRAVTEMKHTGLLSAAEYFDRKAMRVVEHDFPELQGLPEDAGAVLIKIEASTAEQLKEKESVISNILSSYNLILNSQPLQTPDQKPKTKNQKTKTQNTPLFLGEKEATRYWAMRSGIFPAVGGTREIGTTCLIEDIAFPIDFLAEATADLQALFREHNYPDAVIYGHALEGNYHFILNQRFDTQEAISQYDRMMHAVVSLVVDKYHGSLKAEHGTGRNMAPFVRREWGDKAYQLMRDVKDLFDPENIMNPGVIFNEDEQSYLMNLKPLPEVDSLIDRCIECGFCEVNCVSCGFAFSSRQRIVLQREIARLERLGEHREAERLRKAFRHEGKDLCAGDGLCSTSCPVGINVGEYIHLLREREMSAAGKSIGRYAANHFSQVGGAISSVLSVAGFAQDVLGNGIMSAIGKGLHLCGIPLWTPAMPRRVKNRFNPKVTESQGGLRRERVVYFPSCLNQRLGLQKGSPASQPTMGDMVELLQKAGYEVIFPENMQNLCCGTIWESKGMPGEADMKARELHEALRLASNNYQYPIVCDQSPCLYRIRHTLPLPDSNSQIVNSQIVNNKIVNIYEPAEFIEKYVLDKLDITPADETVMLHVTCSMRKMGLGDTLLRVAQRCAKTVVVPEEIGCCAFAGDKGFTHPELNRWALRKLRGQVEKHHATLGISNSRTCEIGLSLHSGIPYMNIAYLVNKVSKAKK